ncbi:citrate lyase subunit beta [Histoplasma mississippiense (nom. inval.)]|uniref:citrate lyase subunit beta n=1 Tax=Ajellomyces capsulatus (strain NAm1 / WU24) TaxID=2059318 RepID=UPI000157BF7F|nr:citrate lyase subunit beta [Histoplasma mississippiense (nom. inval.)]EDN06803.1 citrate lyase subunit beta [Histoplasma mississippiense (nom. inval.)]
MASTGTVLRRALLYVPGSSQRMLDKSRNLVADCVAYDLEDSVSQTRKAEARTLIRNAIDQPKPSGIKERAVRINSVSSGLALADLTEMVIESASDLHFISDVISHTRSNLKPTESNPDPSKNPPISVIALIESAKSILNLPQICTAATHQLSGLVFAAADFSKDLSITQTPSLTEFLYARSAIVTAACAHKLSSIIDLVCTDFKTPAVLEDEVLNGKRMGFNGKQCIHPSQVELVQQLFSPELKEVEWAVRVIVADTKAAEDGRGAWTLDGMMIDVPVVERSRDIVKKAELCGLDVAALKKKFASL